MWKCKGEEARSNISFRRFTNEQLRLRLWAEYDMIGMAFIQHLGL